MADEPALAQIRREAICALAISVMSKADAEAWAYGVAPDRIVHAIQGHEVWVYREEAMIGWVEVDQDRIAALYVSPARAGRGVGSALLAHAETMILHTGYFVAHLDASPNALAFYLRRGYQRDGMVREDGAYPMCKRLSLSGSHPSP